MSQLVLAMQRFIIQYADGYLFSSLTMLYNPSFPLPPPSCHSCNKHTPLAQHSTPSVNLLKLPLEALHRPQLVIPAVLQIIHKVPRLTRNIRIRHVVPLAIHLLVDPAPVRHIHVPQLDREDIPVHVQARVQSRIPVGQAKHVPSVVFAREELDERPASSGVVAGGEVVGDGLGWGGWREEGGVRGIVDGAGRAGLGYCRCGREWVSWGCVCVLGRGGSSEDGSNQGGDEHRDSEDELHLGSR